MGASAKVFDKLPEEIRSRLVARSHPKWSAPMLATLSKEVFSDPEWIFERKLDGERALAFRQGRTIRLLTRNRKELNRTYPELLEPLLAQPVGDFAIDGEIVAFEGGRTSFSRLQKRMQRKDAASAAHDVAVFYYVFDVMHLEGRDTSGIPLRHRKALLRSSFEWTGRLRYSAHRNASGASFFEEACRKGWEGLIAKRADSAYVHSRSRDWLKLKCESAQELVIGGYTEPQGSRSRFGALLVGYYEDGSLVYAGKVGTGFDDATLAALGDKLERIERATSPFTGGDVPAKNVHWVTPRLVAQVGFTEWTGDHKLRHPRFLGLRDDKDAGEVTREVPT